MRVTEEQKAGKVIGDMICCVEYNSADDWIQIVPYADLEADEGVPTLGDHWDPETGIAVVSGYENALPPYWHNENEKEMTS